MIACELYDYVEIACMQRLKLRLHMLDGSEFECIALDTGRGSDKREALIVQLGEDHKTIALEDIKDMQSMTKNPHFDVLNIAPNHP